MSLRIRLSILITVLFISVFIGAGVFLIQSARDTVLEDINSSASHTLKLVEALLESVEDIDEPAIQQLVLENLSQMVSGRDLQIVIKRYSEGLKPFPPASRPEIKTGAPGWFVNMVQPPPLEFRRIISLAGISGVEVIILADPSAEITEVWFETRNVLFFLMLFIILANFLLYFALGRYLSPISSILTALERIEHGDYRQRLPQYELPELSRISDRVNHMADVLLASRNENRKLAQKTLAIQEQERRHLAQELHDELGQSLSAIKAIAVSIEKQADESEASIRNNAVTIGSFSERMYEVARNMMQRLRPTVLDELGLLVALQEMIDDWNQRHGDVFCHFNCRGDISGLDEDVNIHLYRIIQESLTNVIKHSKAEEVFIDLQRDTKKLEISIRDDGCGFEPEGVNRGLGLLGMQERVEAVNGKITIDSNTGDGVHIEIILPLPTMQGDETNGVV